MKRVSQFRRRFKVRNFPRTAPNSGWSTSCDARYRNDGVIGLVRSRRRWTPRPQFSELLTVGAQAQDWELAVLTAGTEVEPSELRLRRENLGTAGLPSMSRLIGPWLKSKAGRS